MNEHDGYEIPVEALSAVFAEQRAEIARKRSLQKAKEMKLAAGALNPPDDHIQAEMAAWFEREKGALVEVKPEGLGNQSPFGLCYMRWSA